MIGTIGSEVWIRSQGVIWERGSPALSFNWVSIYFLYVLLPTLLYWVCPSLRDCRSVVGYSIGHMSLSGSLARYPPFSTRSLCSLSMVVGTAFLSLFICLTGVIYGVVGRPLVFENGMVLSLTL